MQNVGANVGPVTVHLPGDSHLSVALGLNKVHVGRLVPCIHVLQDSFAQIRRWIIHEGYRQADFMRLPVFRDHHGKVLGLRLESRYYRG